jgi:hypothetical protein
MSNVHLAGKGAGNRVPYVVRALQVKVEEVVVVVVVVLVVVVVVVVVVMALADNSFKKPWLHLTPSLSLASQADLEAENSRLKSTIANLRQAHPRLGISTHSPTSNLEPKTPLDATPTLPPPPPLRSPPRPRQRALQAQDDSHQAQALVTPFARRQRTL